jgi:hypothetical protein
LEAAQLGGHYTRTTKVSPDEFYGLIDPDSVEFDRIMEDYIKDRFGPEYDNE